MLRTFLPLFAFLAALAVELAYAVANPSANLNGVVYSEATNQRVPHASVWLCDDGGNRLLEAVTSENGEFSFPGLHAGAYILKITATGFVPLEMNVEVTLAPSTASPSSSNPPENHKKNSHPTIPFLLTNSPCPLPQKN